MAGRKVLVTGGAGFIGSHVCEELASKGYEVAVFDDFSSGKEGNLAPLRGRIWIIRGDICDRKAVAEAVKGNSHVIHLAALVSVFESMKDPEKCRRINEEGTRNVLEAAAQNKARKVVLASSAAVYGDAKPPISESAPCVPLSPYGQSKAQNEMDALRLSLSGELSCVCLRYFNVYGPRQDPSSQYSGVIAKFAGALRRNETPVIYGDGGQTRDFVYVRDVARATVMAMESPVSGEAINIGTGRPVSVNELFAVMCRLFGKRMEPGRVPAKKGDIRHSYADVSKAQGLLGFSAQYPLVQGLKETIAQI